MEMTFKIIGCILLTSFELAYAWPAIKGRSVRYGISWEIPRGERIAKIFTALMVTYVWWTLALS